MRSTYWPVYFGGFYWLPLYWPVRTVACPVDSVFTQLLLGAVVTAPELCAVPTSLELDMEAASPVLGVTLSLIHI